MIFSNDQNIFDLAVQNNWIYSEIKSDSSSIVRVVADENKMKCSWYLLIEKSAEIHSAKFINYLVSYLENGDALGPDYRNVLTVTSKFSGEEMYHSHSTIKAIKRNGNLLYASRSPIPFDGFAQSLQLLPIYGLRNHHFKPFSKDVKPGPLEISEKIEILRFIEQGVPVKILHFEG